MANTAKDRTSPIFALSLESLDANASLIGAEDPQLTALIEGVEPEREHAVDNRYREVIVPLLDQLPPREADMLEMYCVARKREADIADLFDVTQAAVSYMLKRARQRLAFLVRLPKLSDDEIRALLETTPLPPMDIDILLDYRHTSRQVETAQHLGLSQGKVRHRLFTACRMLEGLSETRPELREVTRMMCMLRDTPNILKRVQLPQWAGRGDKARDDRYA